MTRQHPFAMPVAASDVVLSRLVRISPRVPSIPPTTDAFQRLRSSDRCTKVRPVIAHHTTPSLSLSSLLRRAGAVVRA